ncbi:MAG: hypothetical protein IPL92_15775 [Saprospiraceae bacterium]|nr:hypothetical protein [Candidatus Opimibacter iunctus]
MSKYPKKEIERRIFDLVYGTTHNLVVEHKDKPDFWVHLNENNIVGVEVTEFFDTESSARLKNIPDYLDSLLDRNEFKHAEDRQQLKVDRIKIVSENDEVETDAVIQVLPSISTYLSLIEERISLKSKSIEYYDKRLNHSNLIIHDLSGVLSSIERREFYNVFYQPGIVKVLLETKFREIYFITKFNKEEFSLPLKAILYVSRIYFFHDILIKSNRPIEVVNTYYNWLAEFLAFQGFRDVKIVTIDNLEQVVFGNIGFLLMDFSKTVLHEFGDNEIPLGISVDKKEFIDHESIGLINKWIELFRFEIEMGKRILLTT